ncbi:DUF3054 domain-containing protein [[Mycobacterium] wendilense]|uniref:DUF3054 domain-containing protein n=1 Tax=[Mycobacterium] wendilense TaxID=3064284 RepID=A0ABN9PB08_9MYCO|nr:DUF3054 domain-containing protein [Mycolicibacterium sp. MU0050]CAJ1586404.1 DUF3054 domain-containing protein [Mycolicibacterium sp. MU0050]
MTENVNPRTVAAAAAADTAAILAFCALGRRSHDEGVNVAGVGKTAWPFLSGTAVGWLLSRGWRAPGALRPTGLVVWASTVIFGMLLRKASSATVAAPFIAVTSAVTAVLLLGWRAATGRRATDAR